MASFDKRTPVLRLSFGKAPSARWVLWPVLAWRVVAPVPKERPLNLFQRAVLRLGRAGTVRAVDVADRLLIAPDLAALVNQELQGMGYIDNAGAPTKKGLAILEDIEDEPPDEARVGNVLSDPFTGKLWPRFLTGDLPIADVEPNEDGWPVLLSGSAGDPWRDRTYSVLPGFNDAVIEARPSARDVLWATRRHLRQRDFDEVDDGRDVPRLRRVSFIDERPYPYMLGLRVTRHESGDWCVQDPFGHGESTSLRTRIEERLDFHPGLRAWLAPLVGGDLVSPTLGQLQTEAEWKVEERLTLAIRQHETVRERLVAMQRVQLEASAVDAPADKWDDVLVKAQRAVERALHVAHRPYEGGQPPFFASLAWSDKRFNRSLLDAIADEIGFRTPLPASLASVRRGKVQNAEQYGTGSLRPLALLTLLCAGRHTDHPLACAASSQPDLLHRLDALASARDRAAHDGGETRSDQVDRHVETTYLTVQSLLIRTDIQGTSNG